VASLLAKMAAKQPVARQLLDVYTRVGEKGIKEIMDAFEGIVAEHARRLSPVSGASAAPSPASPAASHAASPSDAFPIAPRIRVDTSALFDRGAHGPAASGADGTGRGSTLPPSGPPPRTDEAAREDVPVPGTAPGPPQPPSTRGKSLAAEPPVPEEEVRIPYAEESGAVVPRETPSEDLDRSPHFEAPATPGPRPHHLRIPFQYDDDDVVYVHGVTIVPVDEKSEPRPFMLEEKGLDSKEFAFAMDRGGLRFFLSRIDRRSISVSKTGLMLSGKQESLRLQGVHEGVLNDLRAHGVVLPFEFGTIARSKDELIALVDERLYDLHDAVDDLLATSWWKLTVSMLDAKLAGIIGTEPGERERKPSTRQSASTAKMDIKVLEKILGRQKRLAETVHEEMKKVADRAEVELMVGFSSGTSDEWKPILRASYLVPPSRTHKLHRAITDIQYRHMMFDLMLTLTGDQPAFSLHAAR
jgi:hypothetical protein